MHENRCQLLVILVALLAVVACNSPARKTPSGATVDERISRITGSVIPAVTVEGDPVETEALADLMAENNVPGVSVAVFRKGEIEWARGFGLADKDEGRPVTPETLFQAASISKPVAAVAALSLVEEGRLDLDEDVNLELTSWKVPSNELTEQQPVTLREILSHTAGLTVHGFPGYEQGSEIPTPVEVLKGEGNTAPILVDLLPGSEWRYSGGGYTVMQQLLVDVVGKPFPEIIRERVLEPAGMSRSTYQQPLPAERAGEASSAYDADGKGIPGKWHIYPEMAAAGLWTTPSDLARFAIAIQKSLAGEPGGILSQAMAHEMLEPGLQQWGLGPSIEWDGLNFGHGGSNRGFRCGFTASLKDGWGIAIMTNGARGVRLITPLMVTIAQSYGWSVPRPEVRKRVEIGEEALQRLAGRYQIEGLGVVTLEPRDGRLFAHLPEQGSLEFLPQSETRAVLREDGREVNFLIEKGKVTGFNSPGIEARRIN